MSDNGSFQFWISLSPSHGRLIGLLTTQAWKQTLPPSDRTLYYTPASV